MKSKRIIKSSLLVLLSLFLFYQISVAFADSNNKAVIIQLDEINADVSVHTELQAQYLNDSLESVLNYVSGDSENSQPESVSLSWKSSIDETFTASEGIDTDDLTYKLYVDKDEDLEDARCYETNDTSYSLTNLEINTTYYYKVSLELADKTFESNTSSFTTEDAAPRFLKVDGVTNVRDLGGYTTLDGSAVKQGMLIRSGKLHNRDKSAVVTEEGKRQFVDDLGVKTEIDLRKASDGENGNVTESALGSSVTYYALPMDYSGNLLEGTFTEDNVGSLKKLFEILSDEENYPIVFHCVIGTDRTGMVSYLLEALFGMSENDILRDYLISNFANINETRTLSSICTKFHRVIKNYDGTTLQEKTYRYLNEVVGIPTSQLDEVIRINVTKASDEVVGTAISCEADFLNMLADGAYYLSSDITVSQTYQEVFTGLFDGNGHKVTVSAPLFNKLSGTIKNLTIEGAISDSSTKAGALAREGTNFSCIGITNLASVVGPSNSNTGGLVGYSKTRATFINCKNCGDITSDGLAAGIICLSDGDLTLKDCSNAGDITAKTSKTYYYAGGIVARSNGNLMIEGCSNAGTITASAKHIGGICGYANGANLMKTLISCSNNGDIISKDGSAITQVYHGGVVGYMYGSNSFCTLSYCSNSGKLISENTSAVSLSGICGYVNSAQIMINYCTNTGDEEATTATNPIFYHLFYNKGNGAERFIHDNDIWKYDNVSFTIEGKGTFVIPHEMTIGEWLMSEGGVTGNKALWVSPVTGYTDEEINASALFASGGIWHYYRNDEQGKVYLEIDNHCDIVNNEVLPSESLLNPKDNTKCLTVFDLIEPNAVYSKQ